MLMEQLLARRIALLDGAMGTMIQAARLAEEDYRGARFQAWERELRSNNDLLSITQPRLVRDIHWQYLEAGADILETNTFNSTSVALADYGMERLAREFNTAAALLARDAVRDWQARHPGDARFVAGALGPTNRTASLSPDVNDPGYRAITFDQLVVAYKEQAKGLMDGGADALLVIHDLYEETGRELPIMISGTITDASGRTLSGQTTEAFLISLSHVPLLSIGLNCALGAKQLRPYLQVLNEQAPFFVSAYPNAGLPNEFGQYDQGPQEMGEQIEEFLKEGL